MEKVIPQGGHNGVCSRPPAVEVPFAGQKFPVPVPRVLSIKGDEDEGGEGRVVEEEGGGCCASLCGYGYMLLSGLSFSLMSLLISQLGDRFSSFQLLGLRSSTGSMCCVVWLVAQKVGVLGPREDRGKLLTRALVGTFAMCCNWYVITQLPLAEATCIIFSAPLWTMVIARIWIGERLGAIKVLCFVLGMTGVFFVSRPEFLFDQTEFLSSEQAAEATEAQGGLDGLSRAAVIAMGIVGAVASGLTNVLVRRLKHVHALVTILYLMVAATVACAVAAAVVPWKAPTDSSDSLSMAGICVAGLLGQVFKTQGLKMEQAGPASMMRMVDLVFAFLLQWGVQGKSLHLFTVVGGGLILLSATLLALTKLNRRPCGSLGCHKAYCVCLVYSSEVLDYSVTGQSSHVSKPSAPSQAGSISNSTQYLYTITEEDRSSDADFSGAEGTPVRREREKVSARFALGLK